MDTSTKSMTHLADARVKSTSTPQRASHLEEEARRPPDLLCLAEDPEREFMH